MTRKTLLVVLAAALVAAAPAAAASEAAKPAYREEDDRLVITNDLVTFAFEHKRPVVRASPAANESTGWTFAAKRLVEFFDEDGDGVVDPGETRAVLNLSRNAPWTLEHRLDESVVELSMTYVGRLAIESPAGEVPLDLPAAAPTGNVTLRFALAASPAEVAFANGTLKVPASAARMSVLVNAWTFIDARDKLAFVADVAHGLDRIEGGVYESAAVLANDATVGELAWSREAVASTGRENATVPVRADLAAAGNATRVVWSYDAPGAARLEHASMLAVAVADTDAPAGGAPDLLGGLKTPVASAPATAAAVVATAGLATLARRR